MFGQPCRPPACAARHQSCQPAMARRSPVAVVAAAAALIAAALSSSQPGWLAPRFALRPAVDVIAAAPTLAPSPTRTSVLPGAPEPLDEKRYSEGVRWFMDEEMEKPPDWHVLLLDKTFEQKKNTVAHVAACISAVVGLATVVAMRKTQHAKDNFYSVLQTTEKFSEAVRVAQALQGRGLVVRVAPGARLPPSEDGRLGRRGQRRGRRRRLQRARRAATM
ncbi:unnamed protein product [Prorocentrum cordatum]|uniref:Adaptor protein ClpS core domain-containing protein n=1 Tax=Prorocentrum cordatum TaxID=2364126 RepID=A0ABN9UFP1_9DINO|nr:unnamed protein product [Polarella glacialis]